MPARLVPAAAAAGATGWRRGLRGEGPRRPTAPLPGLTAAAGTRRCCSWQCSDRSSPIDRGGRSRRRQERSAAREYWSLAAGLPEDAGVVRDAGWQVEAFTSIALAQRDRGRAAELLAAPWSLSNDARPEADPRCCSTTSPLAPPACSPSKPWRCPMGRRCVRTWIRGWVQGGAPLPGLPDESLLGRQLRVTTALAHPPALTYGGQRPKSSAAPTSSIHGTRAPSGGCGLLTERANAVP